MTPERWNKIKDVFSSVQDLPVPERWEFLSQACGGDDDLRAEVQKLIDSSEEEDGFLLDSAIAGATSIVDSYGFEDELLGDADPLEDRFETGTVLKDRYEIVRMLGKGGMGKVYLAVDRRFNRNVALKVLHPDLISSKENLSRFAREAQTVSALNHPHILTIYESDRTIDGSLFFVAEYVDGQTLNWLVGEKLKPIKILDIAIQVSSALTAAHEAGIVHRDIKPENIMVRRDGYVKVLDFGLAKLNTTDSPSAASASEDPTIAIVETRPGLVMGTVAYMSPEQARGLPVDARTDIWSLGVVIYEMLTGRRPFVADTNADTIVAVLSAEPAPISLYNKEAFGDLQLLVSKALAKNIETRFQTAEELRLELVRVKKRLEFNEDLDLAEHPDGSASLVGFRSPARAVPTAGEAIRRTIGGVDPASQPHSFWHSTAISGVIRQVQTHKTGSAVAAVILLLACLAGAYFAFLGPASNGRIDSIAVLPFENLSGSDDITYVSDGLSERLIDRLAELPQLKVISRSSSFKFRGPNPDLRQIASQLGVRAIVTGTITKLGEEISIRYDVVDAAEDRHLGGGQVRRRATDIANIQNEIARTAAEHMGIGLTNNQSNRLSHRTTENSEAYRYYLSGLVELNGPDEVRGRALEYFQKATQLDPEFAEPHVEVAYIYWSQANGAGDPAELIPKIKAETERALEIDPNLAKAHVMMAAVYENTFDWNAAEAEYKRAVELSPSLDFARNNYAYFLSVMGRQQEALAQIEEQKERDPINAWMALMQRAVVYSQARRFDEALATNLEAKRLEPDKELPPFALGYLYGGKGMLSEAAAYFKSSAALPGVDEKYSLPLMFLAATYARMPEQRDEAWRILRRVEASNEYASPVLLSMVYLALGDRDKALEYLEKAYEQRDTFLRYVYTGYEFDDLRHDPRFQDLLRRMNLPA